MSNSTAALPLCFFFSARCQFVPSCLISSHLVFLDTVGAHVDAVQELSDILLLAQAGLVDQGCGTASVLNVSAGDDQFILGRGTLINSHPGNHVHGSHHLLSQEVSDLNGLATVDDVHVDGEVRIDKAHLVFELLLNTIKQVADVAAHGVQHGALLALGEVHAGNDFLATISQVQLDRQVLEVTSQVSMFALHLHFLGLDGDLHTLWHLQGFFGQQGLHV